MTNDTTPRANDNNPPSWLDNLIAVTVEDFVVEAESYLEEGEEAIAAAPALVELAAEVVTDIVFRYQLGPQTVMKCVAGRVSALCMAEIERSEVLKKPHLVLVKNTPVEDQ
jgi:hypothetical protein